MEKMHPQKQIKIVSVDDSMLIVERLQTMLSDLAYVKYVGNARNVPSALKLVKDVNPHVVILDINLGNDVPLNNGISLLTILKKSYLDIKVIMFTNLTGNYYQNRCMELGADYFFDKSNDFDKIPEVLVQMNFQSIAK